jgi:hypothetical protein
MSRQHGIPKNEWILRANALFRQDSFHTVETVKTAKKQSLQVKKLGGFAKVFCG